MTDMNWHRLAACVGEDPELFFPGRGEPADEALAICARCRVRGPCLADALAAEACYGTGEPFGVRGGLMAGARHELVKQVPGYKRRASPVVERVRRLARARLGDREIGAELGMTSSAVERMRNRHGIPAGQPQPGHGRLVDRVRAVA